MTKPGSARVAIVVVALAATASVIAVAWLPLHAGAPTDRRSDGHLPVGPTASGATDLADSAPAALALQQPVQRASAYQLDYQMQAAVPGAGDATLRVQASLQVAPELRRGDAVWLPLRLVDARLHQSEALAAANGAVAEAELRKPWLARLQADGGVAEVRLPPGLTAPTQSLLASLALALQFTRPADRTAQSWQANENELNGVFAAQYARQDAAGVTKQRTSAAGRWPQLTATTRFAFDGQTLVDVEVREQGVYPVGQFMRNPQTQPYRISVRVLRAGAATADWAKGLEPSALQPYSQPLGVAKDDRPTRPLATVLGEVAGLQGEATTRQFNALRDEMARSLRQDAAGVAVVVQQLTHHRLQDDAQTIAVAGLVSARSEPALAATAQLIGSPQTDPELRGVLLQAAAMLDTAPPALVSSVASLAVDVAQSRLGALAATTLGALIATQGHTGQSDAGKAALKQLIETGARIVAPATFGEPGDKEAKIGIRAGWLGGFGNTGHPAVLPVVLAALQEEEELVRAHAAFALRFQDPSQFLDLMAEMMAKEKSHLVRDYLVSAMRYMGPAQTLALVEKALRQDKSQMVRLAAAYTLHIWEFTAPGVRKVLQDALPLENSTEVASAIQEFLKPGTSLTGASKKPFDPAVDTLPASGDAL